MSTIMKYPWNENWIFTKDFEKGFENGEKVRLPHNAQEMNFNYCDDKHYQMVCGYKKIFSWQPEWEDKRIFVTFDGAAHEAEIFLNGKKLYKHHCGYTAFSVELTDALKKEENILTVRLDSRETLNQPPFGFVIDYMTYGGIYREVWLEVKEKYFIEDVFVTTKGTDLKIDVSLNLDEKTLFAKKIVKNLKNQSADNKQKSNSKKPVQKIVAEYRRYIPAPAAENSMDQKKAEIYLKKTGWEEKQDAWKRLSEIVIPSGENTGTLSASCPDVSLWEPDAPCLYEIRFHLSSAGNKTDTRIIRFGFRDIRFEATGFYLNNKRVKLRGLNRHQCYPYTGYAMPASMQIEDARILKEELGVNAVRTSHYPQSESFFAACDEMGLLVFTEIPGWQHIGDKAWQNYAVLNVRDMIIQNRNHPSIILWGVRINESLDDDAFYTRTNTLARFLDPTRPTTGVRYLEQSHLLEDVYAYNDFSYTGKETHPLRPKEQVSPNQEKPYFVSEFNGHMFPTKMWDDEKHRTEHALRYAKVLQEMYQHDEVLGCFGWCMFDYNTHKDFGSGDRICYHGVMDMFRNPKLAAAVYRSQQEEEDFLALSSQMDIGEHAGGNIGTVIAFTNADSIRLYKNDIFVREFPVGNGFLAETPSADPVKNMPHPPIYLDDFIGELLETQEGYDPALAAKVKDCLNAIRKYGQESLPFKYKLKLGRLMVFHGFSFEKGVELFGKYVGNWGGEATIYRIEAIQDGKTVATIYRQPVSEIKAEIKTSHTTLVEEATYDVAAVRIRAVDSFGNHLSYFQEPVGFMASGEIEVIGPSVVTLKGGAGGCYVRSKGKNGSGKLTIQAGSLGKHEIPFQVIRNEI